MRGRHIVTTEELTEALQPVLCARRRGYGPDQGRDQPP